MARTALIAVAFMACEATGHAIVGRHDRSDEQYLALGERFTAVGEIQPGGTGTLVAPRWVLTAAHVASGPGGATSVSFAGKVYRVKRAIVHPRGVLEAARPPEVDLALLELESEVAGIEPIPVYRGRDESAHTAVLVGVGDFGAAGRPLAASDHRRRAATNTFADVGPLRLFLTFDAPPAGTDLEGVSGPGDSGGPALIEVDGRVFVAGVSSGSHGRPGQYGLTDVYTRVSAHDEWLSRVLTGA